MAQQFGEARGTINRFVSAAAKIISPIWWISFLSALHVLLFFSFAAAQELFYGTEVHLQNKYSQWGSFLDTNGAGCQGAEACVSAASCPERTTEKTGIWRFLPATTPLRVAPVLYGDEVYIQNAFNGGSAYLDTNGHGCQDNLYCVSGSRQRDRAGVGTGVWRIVSASGKPDGTPVQLGDEFHVQNKYSNWGSYLDTNQRGCQGNRYCVSASERPDRAGAGTGIWRAVAAGTATGSPDDRDAPLSVPIRNLPTLLTKDSNQLSKGKSLDTFLGTAFMDAYRPRESTNTHAQGITITGDGRIVFNYSLNGSGGAPIIWTDKITPDNRTAIRSSFETKFQNYHPSAMQAAGNIVAVTDNDDEGGFGDVRFLYLEPEGNWSELSHLKLAGRKYNGLGFIRHMDGYYYMIGEKQLPTV